MKKATELIDFHAHILPEADHGSRNVETTKAQLELLNKAGVEAVVATPHFYPQKDSVESFIDRRKKCREKLFSIECERPRIYLGAEVLVCEGIDHMPGLERLCIEGTNTILLEMPFSSWREEHIEAVSRIARSGFKVVMAHMDRYPVKYAVRLFSECDVLCQINGETQAAFKGRKKVSELIRYFPCATVGSDIHGADKKAVKNLLSLAKKFEKSGIDHYSETLALLEGAKAF